MPAKFDRCVRAVKRRGGARNAYAVCTTALANNPKKARKRRRKAKKRTVTTTTSRVVRVTNPRPAFVIITAKRLGHAKLKYDGRNFSGKRPKLWGAGRMREAFMRMHQLRRQYARALRGWTLDVELWQ